MAFIPFSADQAAAATNFGLLSAAQKKVWSRELWKAARNNSFIMQFAGSGPNSLVQRITELTRTEKGDRAVIQLVGDLERDGVVGDARLEDNEERINNYSQEIVIDMLRHANRSAGKMAEQRTVVTFRETSRDVLAYWLAERIDQLAFQTLSGLAYTLKPNGATRPDLSGGNTGYQLSDLAFAAGVTAPSTNRHFTWSASQGRLNAGSTAAVTAYDLPSYSMLVEAKAKATDMFVRGIRGKAGEEVYHVFMTPRGLAKLKQDPDYKAAVVQGGPRSESNPFFTGSVMTVDGLIIHEARNVMNTTGTSTKWGASSNVEGQRVLLCGAQALAFADLGDPEWTEKLFDFDNQPAIAVGKIFGFLKPKFYSPITATTEDFGVIAINTAI